jgi:ribonuclease HII
MASAWGKSWGLAWGNAWGGVEGSTQEASQEVVLKPRRKHALKRGKQYLIFDTEEQVQAYLDAERQAKDAIEKAKATSRQAKRRIKQRVISVEHETVDVDLLGELAKKYAIQADIPSLIAEQDWMQIVALSLLAKQMQDEDEMLMLLLA